MGGDRGGGRKRGDKKASALDKTTDNMHMCIGELEHDLHKAFAAARVPSEVRAQSGPLECASAVAKWTAGCLALCTRVL